MMGRLIDRYRVCPRHFSLLVPEQEGHVLFQVVQNGHDPVMGQVKFPCNELRGQGFPRMWKFPDREMMYTTMVTGHKTHCSSKSHLLAGNLLLHVHDKGRDAQH